MVLNKFASYLGFDLYSEINEQYNHTKSQKKLGSSMYDTRIRGIQIFCFPFILEDKEA